MAVCSFSSSIFRSIWLIGFSTFTPYRKLAFSLKISSSISSRVRSSGSTLRRLTHLSVRSRILPASTVHAHDALEHSLEEVCLSHSLAPLVLPSLLYCSLLSQQFPFKTINLRIFAHTQTRRVTISRRRKITCLERSLQLLCSPILNIHLV